MVLIGMRVAEDNTAYDSVWLLGEWIFKRTQPTAQYNQETQEKAKSTTKRNRPFTK
jgi:hypothetical protein